MPVMGGVEATQILKREQPLTPVVMVTASSDASTLDKCRSSGANHVMHKPFTFEALAAQLKEVRKYVQFTHFLPFIPSSPFVPHAYSHGKIRAQSSPGLGICGHSFHKIGQLMKSPGLGRAGHCFNFHFNTGGGGGAPRWTPSFFPLALNHVRIRVLGTFFHLGQFFSCAPSVHL